MDTINTSFQTGNVIYFPIYFFFVFFLLRKTQFVFVLVLIIKFNHRVLGTHLGSVDCLSRVLGTHISSVDCRVS